MAFLSRPLALCGALALALALSGCGEDAPPEAVPSLTVSLASPQLREVTREVVASGAVAAWEEVSVGVELSGLRVASVAVEVGSVVAAGDVLLRIDDRTLASQLAQSDAQVREAQTNLETARRKAARIRELADSQMVALQDAEEAEAARANAQARLNTAIASRDAARVQRDFTVVRAPVGGVVSARSVQPGQVVGGGSELLRLIRDGRLEWRAELAEADLLRVDTGTPVRVESPGGSVVEGGVRTVSPALDAQSRTGTVYVDLPDPGALRAGMFAQGRLALGRAQALLVPGDAIVRRDGRAFVFTVGEDGRAHERSVELGGPHGELVEVRDGLGQGDRVVARGAGFLGDGDLVRVVDSAEAARPADAKAGPKPATGTVAK
ncbi:efflux RND transporter periplasmic adaptor subunit [Luteimonas sp. MC1750]|uniref:efflux RND transporter periplasmic adaptor subunit n=1 Tax=Luteimonas sp. MC1750 TaxID=2799326 RepID=UPI0018F0B2D3|nr:efflux RND transporter periplasmic adaptor subunit [Luteimonas sp. MC1750]MBJ6983821.1 efflux RND transporter periplasmic adaptor subunit [Luteimonas sp. MC1750]QQO06647.1 efflux RND transporter periplasmic adaptor subunit [Luteimonas sp. MC1750]